MHAAERVGDHELGAQQADAVDRQRGDLLGLLGHRQVDVDAGGQRLDGCGDGRACRATVVERVRVAAGARLPS